MGYNAELYPVKAWDLRGTGTIEIPQNNKTNNITLLLAISLRYGILGF
jgi:hypothetical protein